MGSIHSYIYTLTLLTIHSHDPMVDLDHGVMAIYVHMSYVIYLKVSKKSLLYSRLTQMVELVEH
jgi:hypothetical protein